jgi:hypothetical protein
MNGTDAAKACSVVKLQGVCNIIYYVIFVNDNYL